MININKMDNIPLGARFDRHNRQGWVGCREMEKLIQLKMYTQSKFGPALFFHDHSFGRQYYDLVNNHMSKCLYCRNQDENHFDDYINYYKRNKL